jgi:hypothetical protein
MPIITGGKVIEGSRPWYRNNAATGGSGGMGPYSSPGVPASGYLNGIAEPGAVVFNIATGVAYQNTGTKAATVYTSIGSLI